MTNAAPQDRIDPTVSLPPAIRAAAARAEELHRQSLGQATSQVQGQAEAQEAKQSAHAPQAQEAKQSAPAPQQGDAASVDWEHRYNSMKGRYDREAQARQQQQAQIAEMQRQLAELQAQRPAPTDVRFQTPQKLVTPEEEQDYGQEFLSVVGKKAKEEIHPEIARLEQQLAELRGQVTGVNNVVAMTAREKMEAHLDQSVPDWRELNTDPDFNAWLDLPDVFSGGIRKQLLHAAYFRNDAPRVAAFFKGFIADEAATNPARAGAGQAAVTSEGNPPGGQPAKVPLETFAAPGRAKTTAAPAPVEKPFFTRAQISQFYSDVQKGVYAGRDAEKAKVETAIYAAQREGRIR